MSVFWTDDAETIDAIGENTMVFARGGGDTIRGGDVRNSIFGEGGSDSIEGGGGTDILVGGADNDTISGGEGHDFILGDARGVVGDDSFDGDAGILWPSRARKTSCTTGRGVRTSEKQAAKRSTSPIARSVAPGRRAPVAEVVTPPPKSATASHPFRRARRIGSGYALRASRGLFATDQIFVTE